jgi:hypothetical protein
VPVDIKRLVKVTNQLNHLEEAAPAVLIALQRLVTQATKAGAKGGALSDVEPLARKHPGLRNDIRRVYAAALESFQVANAQRDAGAYVARADQAKLPYAEDEPDFDPGRGEIHRPLPAFYTPAGRRGILIDDALDAEKFDLARELFQKPPRGLVIGNGPFNALLPAGPLDLIRKVIPRVEAPHAALRDLCAKGAVPLLLAVDRLFPSDLLLDLDSYRLFVARATGFEAKYLVPAFGRLLPLDQAFMLTEHFQGGHEDILGALLPVVKPGAGIQAEDYLETTGTFDVTVGLGALGFRLLPEEQKQPTLEALRRGTPSQQAIAAKLTTTHADVA